MMIQNSFAFSNGIFVNRVKISYYFLKNILKQPVGRCLLRLSDMIVCYSRRNPLRTPDILGRRLLVLGCHIFLLVIVCHQRRSLYRNPTLSSYPKLHRLRFNEN